MKARGIAMSWLLVLLALLPLSAAAQEPKIRASLAVKGDLWVGQRAALVIELLAPGFFAGAPAFDLPDVPGLLLMPPVGSPVVSSEESNGVNYTVQRHELSVFAQRAGPQRIPAFTVRFHFKRQPLDKDEVPASARTEPLNFTAKSPPGAEKLGAILSARDLKAVEEWKPKPGRAKAGDAFTRTITFSATDLPAMAFPPFRPGRIDGLGIYPQAPAVEDHNDRGTLSGQRRDTVTYVCQRAGHFVVPAVQMKWWNLQTQKLETIDFPPQIIEVAVAVAPGAAGTATSPENSRRFWIEALRWLGILALLAAIVGASLRLGLLSVVRQLLLRCRPVHLVPLNPTEPDSPAAREKIGR